MVKVTSYMPQMLFEARGGVIPPGWEINFAPYVDEDGVIEACKGADFLMVTAANPPVTAKILENIGSVKHLQVFGAGFDKVDLEAAKKVNLSVSNTPALNATTVAEYTVGVLVLLQRKIFVSNRALKAGDEGDMQKSYIMGNIPEIMGTKVGLVGLGAIGKWTAKYLTIMGAQVSYFDIFRADPSVEKEFGLTFTSFEDLLANNDVISVHCPLNDDTRDLINKKEFALMKKGALLINSARGEIVNSDALAEALESGHLGGAAVDHFGAAGDSFWKAEGEKEEKPAHPLLSLSPEADDRFIATTHMAGVTAPAFARMLVSAMDNMKRVAAGDDPQNVVNGVLKARK